MTVTWKPNLATRIVTSAFLLAPAPAAFAGNTLRDHNRLWDAIEDTGTEIIVNHPEACEDSWGGGIYSMQNGRSYLVVCQDEGERAGLDNQVQWSANDLDTLRHEAHHLLQDCLAGVRGDGELEPLMSDPQQHRQFVLSSLTQERISQIIKTYTEDGADEELLMLELEAFAVAEDVDAGRIANGVAKACSRPRFRF